MSASDVSIELPMKANKIIDDIKASKLEHFGVLNTPESDDWVTVSTGK